MRDVPAAFLLQVQPLVLLIEEAILVDQQPILMLEAVELLHDLPVLVVDCGVVRGGDLRDAAFEVEAQLPLLGLAHFRADIVDLDGRVFYDILGGQVGTRRFTGLISVVSTEQRTHLYFYY